MTISTQQGDNHQSVWITFTNLFPTSKLTHVTRSRFKKLTYVHYQDQR